MTSPPENQLLMTLFDIKLLEPTPSNESTYTLRIEVTGSNNVLKIAGETLIKDQASDEEIHIDAMPESIIVFTLLRNRRRRRERMRRCETSMSSLIDMQKSSGSCVLRGGELELSFTIKDTRVQDALNDVIQKMRSIHLDERENWSTFFTYFKTVKAALNSVSALHPYLQQVWNVFLIIPDSFEAHLTRNSNINQLCERLKDIYKFILDANQLPVFAITQHKNLELLFRQTLVCVNFIKAYVDGSTAKNTLKGPIIDKKIQEYQKSLNQVFDAIQRSLSLEMHIVVHDTRDLVREIHNFNLLGELPYAANAGFQGGKKCLPRTREELIEEVLDWVNTETTQRVLVLSGQAGMGKSAIAHTIYGELKGTDESIASIFCFNRSDLSRINFIFSTISRNLADHDPSWLQSLVQSIRKIEIMKSPDLTTQFDELIIKPSQDTTKPVVIIIDALDEGGERGNRGILLDLLFRRSSELPGNYRLIITTRPESDIRQYYEDPKHKVIRMADINPDDTRKDIRQFIIAKLSTVRERLDKVTTDWSSELAEKAQCLFQWAHLACCYIVENPTARLKTLLSKGAPTSLYEMYHKILDEKPSLQDEDLSAAFQTIIRAILVSRKPLSVTTLQALFEPLIDNLDVKAVLAPVHSLFLGVDGSTDEIRPLHTSLFDFFSSAEQKPKTPNRYYIDTSDQTTLTHACLRLMNNMLRFNICKLETSHRYNRRVENFDSLVEEAIPPHLSYACCFWAYHLKHSCLDHLLGEINKLMDDNLLYFFEVLSLLGEVEHGCIAMRILEHKTKDKGLSRKATDTYQFGCEFGDMMEESTPHLYLTALPFTRKDSFIYRQFIHRYPQLLNTEVRQSPMYPPVEYSIVKRNPHGTSCSLAFSPKDMQIATGFDTGEVWLWDYITGEITYQWKPPNAGMRYPQVMFSPNGEVVHCCFENGTIVTWNIKTNETTQKSYEGITQGECTGCAISPDGRYISFRLQEDRVLLHDTKFDSTYPLGKHRQDPTHMFFSPNGVWFAFERVGGLGLWNTRTRSFFSPTGTGLFDHVSGLGNKYAAFKSLKPSLTLEVWDIQTNKRTSVIGVYEGYRLTFTPDERYLFHDISGLTDPTFEIHDVSTGELISRVTPRNIGSNTCSFETAISPDCKHVALTMDIDGSVCMLSWDTLIQTPSCHDHEGKGIVLSVWLKDHHALLHIEYSSIRNFQILDITRTHNDHELLDCDVVAVSPEDDQWSIAYIVEFHGLCLWNIDTREEIILDDSVDECLLAFSFTGDRLIVGGSDGNIKIWNVRSRQLIMDRKLWACHLLKALNFSPTGTTFLIAYTSANGKLLIEELDCVSRKTRRGPFEVNGPKDCHVRFLSANDARIVGAIDDELKIWDASTGTVLSSFESVLESQLSPNGKYVAVRTKKSEENDVEIWDLDRHEMIARPTLPDGDITHINFSTDSARLYMVSRWVGDRYVDIWDIGARKLVIRSLQVYTSSWQYDLDVALHGDSLFLDTNDPRIILDLRIVKIMESLYNNDHRLNELDLRMLPANIDSLDGIRPLIEDYCTNPGNIELLGNALRAWNKAMFSPFSKMDEIEGWVLGPHDELLFWVMPSMRDHLWRPGASYVGDRLPCA